MKGDAFMLGYQIGRQSSVIWKSEGEVRKPIAYLYNGVRLPALPEWDRERYPFALIYYHVALKCYILDCFAENAFYWRNSDGYLLFGGDNAEKAACFECKGTLESGWYDFNERDNQNIFVEGHVILRKPDWSNFDMEYEGTMYLEASEPVPVYE